MSLRNDWTRDEIQTLYDQPFLDLVFDAQSVHRQHFQANTIQVSTLLRLKQVNVLKTVSTVLSQHVMTQNLKPKNALL